MSMTKVDESTALRDFYEGLTKAADVFREHPELWTPSYIGVQCIDSLGCYPLTAEDLTNVNPLDGTCTSCAIGMAIRCGTSYEYYARSVSVSSGHTGFYESRYYDIEREIYRFNDGLTSAKPLVEAIDNRAYPFQWMKEFD